MSNKALFRKSAWCGRAVALLAIIALAAPSPFAFVPLYVNADDGATTVDTSSSTADSSSSNDSSSVGTGDTSVSTDDSSSVGDGTVQTVDEDTSGSGGSDNGVIGTVETNTATTQVDSSLILGNVVDAFTSVADLINAKDNTLDISVKGDQGKDNQGDNEYESDSDLGVYADLGAPQSGERGRGAYSAYCGDKTVNQDFEQCDGGATCTKQCQLVVNADQCTSLVFGRVVVDDVQNWKTGDATSDLYLGSASNVIPQGVWFPIHDANGWITDQSVHNYEDIPGVAVTRKGDGNFGIVLYGSHPKDNVGKENISGKIEVFNSIISSVSTDYTKHYKLENWQDGSGVGLYKASDDEARLNPNTGNGQFWSTVTSGNDTFLVDAVAPQICGDDQGTGSCSDGFDNDHDGLIDSLDPDCGPNGSGVEITVVKGDNGNNGDGGPIFCGNGKQDQAWEQCDGTEGCTDQCQYSGQCTDKAFARVKVQDFSNSGALADTSDRVFLGSSSNEIPNGTWFLISSGGVPVVTASANTFQDVPGLAVETGTDGSGNYVRVMDYSNHKTADGSEHNQGVLEVFNTGVTSAVSDPDQFYKMELDLGQQDTLTQGDATHVLYDMYLTPKADTFLAYYSDPLPCNNSCGDSVVNQEWEQCDGTEGCNDRCQFDQQCSDKAFAKINFSDVSNTGDGDTTSDLYVGGNTLADRVFPNTWFYLGDSTSAVTDADISGYQNVAGLAVQRGSHFVHVSNYGFHADPNGGEENLTGTITFAGTTVASVVNDTDQNKMDLGGQDTYSNTNTTVDFKMHTGPAADGFVTNYNTPDSCGEQNTCNPNTELITNGSFETPLVTDNGGDWQIFPALTAGLSWIPEYLSGNPDPALELQAGYSSWTPKAGEQFAELDGNESTRISEDIPTVIGNTYSLKYSFSPRPGVEANDLKVSVDGVSIDTQSADGTGLLDTSWTDGAKTFVATNATSTISFENTDVSDSLGTFVDAVSLRCTDVCSNIEGVQAVVPDGDVINSNGLCVADSGSNGSNGNNGGGGGGSSGGSGGSSNLSGGSTSGEVLGASASNPGGEVLAETGINLSPLTFVGIMLLALFLIVRPRRVR